MKPELRSNLTTILAIAMGVVATWLVKNGIIAPDLTDSFVQAGIGAIFALGAAAVTWWKGRQNSSAALVANIKTMSATDASTAVESLPTSAKNAIKIATMPPATIVAAAAALPDVSKVEIKFDAGPALSAVAEDQGQPKVVSQTATKG